jgi:hypothetical protein
MLPKAYLGCGIPKYYWLRGLFQSRDPPKGYLRKHLETYLSYQILKYYLGDYIKHIYGNS